MSLTEIQNTAGFGELSSQTVLNAIHERGLKAYHEGWKFILEESHMVRRVKFCEERKDWEASKEWANWGFTDEMSIEVGAFHGVSLIWRDKSEKWEKTCMGAKKKQGPTVMCWGMIMWNKKGLFYVWSVETEEEKKFAEKEIARLNAGMQAEADIKEAEWKASSEWAILKKNKLAIARTQCIAAKARGEKIKTIQSWRGIKYKPDFIEQNKNSSGGVDAWRHCKYVGVPILWPECTRLLVENPLFVLMEDNASSHSCKYTTREREKWMIPKVNWPSCSPDFNLIEKIWNLMKKRIGRVRVKERITTIKDTKVALYEAWEALTVEEINRELPEIMAKCLLVKGDNNYNA